MNISFRLGEGLESARAPADTAWTLNTAPWILLMQLGFALLEAGSVREHNAIATFAKNSIDLVISVWMTAGFGYALSYSLVSTSPHPLAWTLEDEEALRFFQHVCFQATSATIVSGAMAERTSIKGCTLHPSRPLPGASRSS